MINSDKAVQKFKEKFDAMTFEDREKYLHRMGFVFSKETRTLKKRTARNTHYPTKGRYVVANACDLSNQKKCMDNNVSVVAVLADE